VGIFGRGYNTPLNPQQMEQFQRWRQSLPANLQGTQDYDLQGAFLGNAQAAANGHLTDQWKKPNHMTFSTGSQYSTPDNPGGVWADATPKVTGDDLKRWVFWASKANLQSHGAKQLSDYFQQNEPNSTVVLPINYRLQGR
jgi:hypothetical protein